MQKLYKYPGEFSELWTVFKKAKDLYDQKRKQSMAI